MRGKRTKPTPNCNKALTSHTYFKKTVDGSNFGAASAHYLLFTHFTASWEANETFFSEAVVITFFKLASSLN